MQTLGIFFAIYRILLLIFFSSLFCIAFIDRLSTGAVVGAMWKKNNSFILEYFGYFPVILFSSGDYFKRIALLNNLAMKYCR